MPRDREALARLLREAASHLAFSFRTASVAVGHNRLRAALTSLGILFGVASVIAMLAIGKGAEQEILDQMRLLGSNNLVVTPIVEQQEGAVEDNPGRQVERFSPGLTYADAQALAEIPGAVEVATAEVVLNSFITREGRRRSGKVVGIDTTYFRLTNLELAEGSWFNELQVQQGMPVAIVGHGVRTRFFTTESPVGARLKVGDNWVTVVGVLTDRNVNEAAIERLGIRDANMDVYVPVNTMLLRFRNRAQVTAQDVEAASRPDGNNQDEAASETNEQRRERTNLNQLDRIIVHVADPAHMSAVADIAQRMLARRHNDVIDFEITIPELLLQQEQRTRNIFNIVLGAIASISLLVGGIGIMNIMLASVLERIREIGVRRAVGATQRDVLWQFLAEAVLISVAGGVAGILVGGGLSLAIERFAGIQTIVSQAAVAVAFGVSISVGLVFGIVPAYRAARQDVVVCLRYE